jgi:uncharacterized delta-60 repeat protein
MKLKCMSLFAPQPIRTPKTVAVGLGGWKRRAEKWAVANIIAGCCFVVSAQTGTLDTNFSVGIGIAGSFVHAVAISPQGKILLGGNFTRVQGVTLNHFAQLNSDGSLDKGFCPSPGANSEVLAVAFQEDGRVLIGGLFTRVNNTNRCRIARLNADGSLDSSFSPGTGANGDVRCIAVQPDGKVLIGGPFTRFNGSVRNGLARLNVDGTLDSEFNTGTGVGGERFVDELRLLEGGKVLIAGDFPSYNGVARANIARLNSDGTLDVSFDPGVGAKPGDPILGVAIQPDGKILIVGSFTSFNRTPLNNLARLNPDGSLDLTFNPGSGTAGGPINGVLQTVVLEPDGKIIIGGWFDRISGISRSCLARLLPDGKPDTNWSVRVDGQVRVVALQSDHKVLLGGNISKVNTFSSARVARLNASEPVPATFKTCRCLSDGQIQLEFGGDPVRRYLLQTSDDLVQWQTWTNIDCAGSTMILTDSSATRHPRRFYRAVLQTLP